MQIFKFGGASVKDAAGVRNVHQIVAQNSATRLVVVISAMGKTTNALEEVVRAWVTNEKYAPTLLKAVETSHKTIVNELFDQQSSQEQAKVQIDNLLEPFYKKIASSPSADFNFEYDQMVCLGELLATTIVAGYLNFKGHACQWMDVREVIKTDENFREGRVQWTLSEKAARQAFTFDTRQLYITQGFLGSTSKNHTTTLGREGSDYTAAILANLLQAESVTIWKDVPGVMNADPRIFADAQKIDFLSYSDAIELTYYGTSVIHPRTIQPLQNRYIQLYVKSFLEPEASGTAIGNYLYDRLLPVIILKKDQVLLKVATKDFSFIDEEHLTEIFQILAQPGLRINFMQNTALCFQLCCNNDTTRLPQVLAALHRNYTTELTTGMELATIRYYDQPTIERITAGRKVLSEQRNEVNLQLVMVATL